MKKIGRPIPVAVVSVLLLTPACARKEPVSEATEAGSPARASNAPYLTRIEEIRVEYRPIEIPTAMAAGSEMTIQFEAKNKGTTTWPSHGTPPLRFGYHWSDPEGRGNWNAVVWDDGNRGDLNLDVPPGGSAIISMRVKALPTPAKACKLILAPLLETTGGWSLDAPYVATVDIL
jgi:hypothetical protein